MKKPETLIDIFDTLARRLGARPMTKPQEQIIRRFEKAFDSEMQPLKDAAYALCLEIEKLPGSEQQTKISLIASNLRQKIEAVPVGLEKDQ